MAFLPSNIKFDFFNVRHANNAMHFKHVMALFMEGNQSALILYTLHLKLGMATGRVRAGFFHIRTRPAGLNPWSEPDPFTKWVFFPGPRPAPVGPHGPRLGQPDLDPTQKKKKKRIEA